MLNFGQNWQNWYESTQFRFNNLTSSQGHHDPVCGWMYPPFVGGWGDLDGVWPLDLTGENIRKGKVVYSRVQQFLCLFLKIYVQLQCKFGFDRLASS